jgi:hypothetical protein
MRTTRAVVMVTAVGIAVVINWSSPGTRGARVETPAAGAER